MGKKSILTDDMDRCMVCMKPYPEVHHCVYGKGNRKWSDRYGLVVPLCHTHHRGEISPHFDREFDLQLKKLAQKRFQEVYPELSFRDIFGINYL